MKILQDITARRVEESPKTIGGTRAQLHMEPAPGVFVHVSLTADLLVFTHDGQQVAFPVAALLQAAQQHEPALGLAAAPLPATLPKT